MRLRDCQLAWWPLHPGHNEFTLVSLGPAMRGCMAVCWYHRSGLLLPADWAPVYTAVTWHLIPPAVPLYTHPPVSSSTWPACLACHMYLMYAGQDSWRWHAARHSNLQFTCKYIFRFYVIFVSLPLIKTPFQFESRTQHCIISIKEQKRHLNFELNGWNCFLISGWPSYHQFWVNFCLDLSGWNCCCMVLTQGSINVENLYL